MNVSVWPSGSAFWYLQDLGLGRALRRYDIMGMPWSCWFCITIKLKVSQWATNCISICGKTYLTQTNWGRDNIKHKHPNANNLAELSNWSSALTRLRQPDSSCTGNKPHHESSHLARPKLRWWNVIHAKSVNVWRIK